MYPNLYYLFKDLFGLELGFLQIVQSFGFMVALSFLAANYTMMLEMKRKEREGILTPIRKIVTPEDDKNSRRWELIGSIIIGFVLGFKLLGLLFSDAGFNNAQDYFLSAQGNWFLGILLAGLMAGYNYYKAKKTPVLTEPKQELVHPYQLMGNMTIIAAVSGLLGAKLFHNLENWSQFVEDPIGALTSFSGLTFYGGLICGAAAVLYIAKKNNIPWKHMIDIGGPALMLAYGVGRIGCHISGDGDWGVPNLAEKPAGLSWLPDWAWSYNYPHNVLNEGVPIPGCQGEYCNALEVGVYPTPLYESIACIGLFFLLWSLRKRITIPGMLFSIYLVFNGIERFLIEKVRVNTKVLSTGGMEFTQAEIISFSIMLLGIIGIVYFYKTREPVK